MGKSGGGGGGAEGDGWEGVNSSLEGVLLSWRGLLGSSSKANRVCVLVNWRVRVDKPVEWQDTP